MAVNEVQKFANNAAFGVIMANENASVAREELKRLAKEPDGGDSIVPDDTQPPLGE